MGTDTPQDAGQGQEIEEDRAVTVLFFAGAREASGAAQAVVPAAGNTVAQLLVALVCTYGDLLERVIPSCSVWVNRSPAAADLVLQRGDEVALMPPVSGG